MEPSFRSHVKQLFGAAAIIVLATVLPASVAWSEDAKELLFATDPTYPPFEFTKNGVLTGFDIDLVEAIAKAEGFKVKFENVPFDGIIPALKAGTYDAAVAAMVATEERAKSIDFSDPYFKTGLVIIVGSADNTILGEKDLADKRIAVEVGSVGAAKAAKVPGAQVSTFNGSPPTFIELSNGNVDAVIADGASSNYAVATGAVKGVKILPDPLSTDDYAIGFPKDSENADLVNDGLKKVMANGEYTRIYKQWFGVEPPKN
ncbi:arginine/lysine/histidine/glutamine transport system substrate-binding/permease protein [Pararhizobium capsulatum DSM 1112]|uniref:Arginine/lysine/histidine/glutamine transport system substrate-binding/permease protein n=1 Tax=Pararhizobium capsulatum DSM 1112 TaxID=1121113 RepID=A0ABU0C035_9HYPH|nr:basic amino acid ABC transporter substrate-binding protein [Pararhizobium capsulatum]MDQ0323881.1 arginine/lysine/histidine/glutamine transport system substrate-binding/permease protein [Pararhizobium capsulatum DSM 1112]